MDSVGGAKILVERFGEFSAPVESPERPEDASALPIWDWIAPRAADAPE